MANSTYLGRFAALASPLLAVLAAYGCAHETSSASTPGAVIWKVDSLASIGGQTPQVLGVPQVVDAPIGKTLVFNGANDGLIVPINPIEGWPKFTIEVLFDPSAGGTEAQRFFHIEDASGRRVLLEIRLTKEEQWSLDTFLLDGTANLPLNDPTQLHPANRWHWVALRYDGHKMTSFVNGIQQLEGSVAFGPMTTGQTSIGVRLNKIYWFKGGIREVRFTPRALPPEQLQKLAAK
jgi:hypothetical protein